MEVLQSMSGADTDIDALAKRIAQDQAIAARVLRVANSPFYGLQSRVGSIHDAIVVLGLSSVRSLVLAAAVITGLPGDVARNSARAASGGTFSAWPLPPGPWPAPSGAHPNPYLSPACSTISADWP
jgi:hypothetical protein